MTILQDLQIKIDFLLNDKQLNDLEKTLHNVKAEALGLGHSHDAINKSLARTANLYAIAILENEKKLNATNNLTQAQIANANSLKQNNQALYDEIQARIKQNQAGQQTYQVNQKIIDSHNRYKALLQQGAKFSSFSEYRKQEAIEEKKLQEQKNNSLLKQILLMKKQADVAASASGKIVNAQNSQLVAINNTNKSLSNGLNKSSSNVSSFSNNLRTFASNLLFVPPATMQAAFAVQGFGQLFGNLSKSVANSKDTIQKSVASLQSIFFGLAMAISGAAGAVGYFAMSTAKYADEVKKNAEIIGMTTEEYQKLAYAAKINGINHQEMASSLGSLFQTLKDPKDGKLSETQEQFKKLGVALKNSHGESRKVSEILNDVSDKFAKIESPIKRAAMASALFGDSGRKMLPFLKQGSEHLRALGEEADRTGNVLSDEKIKRLVEMQENFRRLTSMLNGLKLSIGMTLLPFMNTLILRLTDWYEASGMVIRQNLEGFFRNVSHGLSRFTQIIRNGFNVVTGFVKVLESMGISLNTLSIILLLFGSWKIFGILGNIILGKGGGNIFVKIASKAKWFFGLLIGFFTGIGTFISTLFAAIGTGGLTGALIFLGDVIIGILAAIFSPAVLIGVAIGALFLLIQDFLTWVEGGDSLFGRMFGDWGNVKKKVLEIVDSIKKCFSELWNNICSFFFENVINPIKSHGLIGILEAVRNIQIAIINLIISGVTKLFEFIGYIIGKIWDGIVYVFQKIPEFITYCMEKISKIWDKIKPYVTAFWNWLTDSTLAGFKSVGEDIYKVFDKIISKLTSIFEIFFGKIKDFGSKTWNSLVEFLGLDHDLGLTKGQTLYKNAIIEEYKKNQEQDPHVSQNNSNSNGFNGLGLVPSFNLLSPVNRQETNSVNYSITSPINLNVNSQSNPQEIANAVSKSFNENWDMQMRAAKQNIYRG